MMWYTPSLHAALRALSRRLLWGVNVVAEPWYDASMKENETTGVYDTRFFTPGDLIIQDEISASARTTQDLEDARTGLNLFIEKSWSALEHGELTVFQRFHVATILSFVEALAKRFDKVAASKHA